MSTTSAPQVSPYWSAMLAEAICEYTSVMTHTGKQTKLSSHTQTMVYRVTCVNELWCVITLQVINPGNDLHKMITHD
jgi:hypothetical protein